MGKKIIWGAIGGIIILIGIYGFYLLWDCTSPQARTQAGNTLLYVFTAIPAVLAIGLVMGIVSGTVFLLLQISGAYHRQVTRDTIELVETMANNKQPLSIELHQDARSAFPINNTHKIKRNSKYVLPEKAEYYGIDDLSGELDSVFLKKPSVE